MARSRDGDLSDWLRSQAALLRLQRFDELDRDRLIEELQTRADELTRRLWLGLVPLLTDLLVWAFGPDGRLAPQAHRIDERRIALRGLLWASPHLHLALPDAVAWAYPRARDASALDWNHLAQEVGDLWKSAAHHVSMLLYACSELCYRSQRHDTYMYHWHDAAFDYQHAMLRSAVKHSPSLRTMLEDMVPEVYAEEQRERMTKARLPLASEPPESPPRLP